MTKLAVIGCGRWGPNHIRVFTELPHSKVVAAADRDPAKLALVQQRFSHLRLKPHHHAALADEEVEAVVVATPTRTHYEVVRDSLLAGKHVLCEKPLCESSAHARKLVELAEERRRVLMTGHVFLFNDGLVALKDVVGADGLGQVRHLSAIRTNLGPIRHDVNAAYDLAAHDIAIFNWLLDRKPIRVSACGAAYLQSGIEDVVSLSLLYPGGVFATVQASWLSPVKVRRISVVGSRRMAAWDDGEANAAVTIYDKGAAVLADGASGAGPAVSVWDAEVRTLRRRCLEPLRAQAQHFLRRVRDSDSQACPEGRFALGVVEALEAACRSMKRGGAPVFLR